MSQLSYDKGLLAELWSKAAGAVQPECSWEVKVAMALMCNQIRSLVRGGIYSSRSTVWNCS